MRYCWAIASLIHGWRGKETVSVSSYEVDGAVIDPDRGDSVLHTNAESLKICKRHETSVAALISSADIESPIISRQSRSDVVGNLRPRRSIAPTLGAIGR